MSKCAVFLNGPVGSGKTSLGRAVAACNGAAFIDGDDLSDPNRPWFCSILQTSRTIVREGERHLRQGKCVVIAYPLTCMNWIYFRRKFNENNIRTVFVSLKASYETITDTRRGRHFDVGEHDRIQDMIAEGYDARAFSDIVFDNNGFDFGTALSRLDAQLRRFIAP
ncbi:hypothetical protein [Komagataeibacter oboediens]|uniref:hypothetical protein n=1 Tax=Komagataeibacter oboediens TaxID=65958 RepID=UPI001C2DABB8|nr:hypothetical protein [Komagataeibacter oboediens]MBV1825165.1 hypothetical protein [Komagataeibacter oboediens]